MTKNGLTKIRDWWKGIFKFGGGGKNDEMRGGWN
jgi:hypothetical protein